MIDTLIRDLKSKEYGVRDKAALQLMDAGDERAITPLIEAILEPENINHRGTLVYALSVFDCSNHIDVLIGLILHGNFEVCCESLSIIDGIPLGESHKIEIQLRLSGVDCASLNAEHNVAGFHELLELSNT